MQRTARELTDVEMIDALNDIIDIICECYNQPLREEFENETRATQIGKDIESKLLQRRILERYSNIGYQTQRNLLDKGIIKTGGIKNQEELEL